MQHSSLINKWISILAMTIILVFWYLSTKHGWVNSMLIPKPEAVWKAFLEVSKDYKGYTVFQHLWISMERLFKAVGLAVLIGVLTGLLSGFSTKIRAVFEPFIEFYRPLPPLAYYTLLVIALGLGDASKIALLFFACLAPIYVSCVSAVIRVNQDYINSAYTLGANKRQVFFSVILPASFPDIFTGFKTAVGVGYTTLVSAEMVAANVGIGWMVLDAKNWLRNDIVFVCIIIMGITGILMNILFNFIQKKFIPWSGKEK